MPNHTNQLFTNLKLKEMKPTPIKIFRRTLRIMSAIFIMFFLLMFIGETFFQDEAFNPKPMSANSILQVLLFVFSMIGLVLAWKWELWGGVLTLVALAVLAIVNPNILNFPLLLIYPATALLFIVLWAIDRGSVIKVE